MEQKKPMDPAILAATMRKLNQRDLKPVEVRDAVPATPGI